MTQDETASKRARLWRFRLVALLLSLALSAMLVEAGARVYLSYLAGRSAFDRYASIPQLRARYGRPFLSPHRYLGYALTPGYSDGTNRINALGYRGDEIPVPKPTGEFRIIVLGGSAVYGAPYHNYKLSLPYRLGEAFAARGYPNVRVINAGCDGWNTWESLIDFALRGQYLSPDLVVIDHGVNDVPPRLVWPREAYRSDTSGRRPIMLSENTRPARLSDYSVALRIFLIRSGRMLPEAALPAIEPAQSTYYGNLFDAQWGLGIYPQGVFRKISAMRMLQTNRPVYFERNIRSIVALALGVHAQVVVCSYPHSPLFTDDSRGSSPEYIFAYGEMNALAKKIAADTGQHFFDFAGAVPADKYLWYDGEHMSDAGNRFAADRLSDYLIGEKLVSGQRRADDEHAPQ